MDPLSDIKQTEVRKNVKDIQTAVEVAGNDDSVQVIRLSAEPGDKALQAVDIQEIHDRPTLKMLMGTSTLH